MPSYKLSYFNARGRAEVSRLMFAVAGVKYEDHRIEQAEWPKIKPTTPLGTIPILEVDGKTIVTSQAIARFLSREFGLYGKNNQEATAIDQVCEVVTDVLTPMAAAFFAPSEEAKAEGFKKLFTETGPHFLAFLEKQLKENNGGKSFFVGNSITLADISFLTLTDSYLVPGMNANGLDKFPSLKALRDRIVAQEKIAAWIKARPQTAF